MAGGYTPACFCFALRDVTMQCYQYVKSYRDDAAIFKVLTVMAHFLNSYLEAALDCYEMYVVTVMGSQLTRFVGL
jgi:hypothetical protein